jgi:hypothetical protein
LTCRFVNGGCRRGEVVTRSSGVRPAGERSVPLARLKGADVRLTDFWQRLDQVFGPGYAGSVANDQVLTQLGGRTIEEALAAGEETVVVWRAVVAAYPERVPAKLR